MDTNDNFKALDEYARDTFLSAIHKQGLEQPVGTATDEDLIKMNERFESMINDNSKLYIDYLEDLVLTNEELEVHQSLTLADKATGEIITDGSFILDKDYVKKKKKEFESFRYYRNKVSRNRPKSGIKVDSYKPKHRFTKVFTTARPEFKSHKNLGIFYDISRELSPFENVVSSQKNNGTFIPMTTKEIQEKFNISSYDMKVFKVEAKKLHLISDVKLGGKSIGIRVNPAYAINGQSFSNDVFEAFRDSPKFTESVSENS